VSYEVNKKIEIKNPVFIRHSSWSERGKKPNIKIPPVLMENNNNATLKFALVWNINSGHEQFKAIKKEKMDIYIYSPDHKSPGEICRNRRSFSTLDVKKYTGSKKKLELEAKALVNAGFRTNNLLQAKSGWNILREIGMF